MYQIPQFGNYMEFLALVARKRGRVGKGGVPDYIAAARVVLDDWNKGKISFYTLPPKDMEDVHLGAEVVSTWAEEFNVSELEQTQTDTLEHLKSVHETSKFMEIAPANADDGAIESFIEGLESLTIEDDEEGKGDGVFKPSKKHLPSAEDALNPRTNAAIRKMLKKKKKKGHSEESEAEDTFDFGTDFVADEEMDEEEGDEESDEGDYFHDDDDDEEGDFALDDDAMDV